MPSDQWKFVKDLAKSKNKKDIDLKISVNFKSTAALPLLKHMADCQKGEVARDLPKSNLATNEGEYARILLQFPGYIPREGSQVLRIQGLPWVGPHDYWRHKIGTH